MIHVMKKTRLGLKKIAVAVCLLAWSPSVMAESAWVGGLFGMSVPNSENSTSRSMYGITGGAKIGSEWGVGGYYLTSAKKEDNAGLEIDFNYDLYGIEFAYHFEGEAAGVFVGGRLGTSKVKSGTVSISPMHYGPVIGFNRMMSGGFSIGGDASYVVIDKGTSAGNQVAGFGMLNFMATAKLWF